MKLKDFTEKHNLRYFLTSDCKLRLSLTGLLVSQYATLKRAISARQSRNECLRELETNVGRLSDDEVERNWIRAASNLLEGIVVDKSANNATTFGRTIDGCENCFPHRALIDSAKKFYKFFNDYPNLKHAGRQALKIRDLKKDDAILTISFAVLFASYIARAYCFAYIVSQGNITATIILFAITMGATAGLSYYKEGDWFVSSNMLELYFDESATATGFVRFLQGETVLSISCIFSEDCAAIFAWIGLDCELSIFPRFIWFALLFFAVWAFNHGDPFLICVRCLKVICQLIRADLDMFASLRCSAIIRSCPAFARAAEL